MAEIIGNTIIKFDRLDSTNNYANQRVLTKAADEGTVVLAQFQKAGKGQKGNSWESEAGKNLLASFIFRPVFLKAADQFYVSFRSLAAISPHLNSLPPHPPCLRFLVLSCANIF